MLRRFLRLSIVVAALFVVVPPASGQGICYGVIACVPGACIWGRWPPRPLLTQTELCCTPSSCRIWFRILGCCS